MTEVKIHIGMEDADTWNNVGEAQRNEVVYG